MHEDGSNLESFSDMRSFKTNQTEEIKNFTFKFKITAYFFNLVKKISNTYKNSVSIPTVKLPTHGQCCFICTSCLINLNYSETTPDIISLSP